MSNSIERIRPMFPPVIDSSLIAALRSCQQKAKLSYVEHYKPQTESVHLVAGGAFAKGVEIARRKFYEDGASAQDSEALGLLALMQKYGDFECPQDSAKSLERTMGALEFYFANYPLGGDGAIPIEFAQNRSGIEFSFAQPLPILHPVSKEPLIFSGRADMIAQFAGAEYIFDEKTTSQLGASWSRQWEMRSQFTGYCWAAKEIGRRPAGVVVRGVSILKTKYDTQQAITYRSDYEIARWYAQTCRDIQRMVEAWESGWWDYNLDHACAEYGGCSFVQVCKSPEPDAWLNTYYEKRVWDPLKHEEVTPEEWENQWPQCKEDIIAIA